MSKILPPSQCTNLKCRAFDIQCDDAGLMNNLEYRETWSCLGCGKSWHNVYRYLKTKRARDVPIYDED